MFSRSGFVRAAYIYTGESYSQLFRWSNAIRTRVVKPSHDILNLAVGTEADTWSAELLVRSAFDERGEVIKNGFTWDARILVDGFYERRFAPHN